MKDDYNKLELEIIRFDTREIITSSGRDENEGEEIGL